MAPPTMPSDLALVLLHGSGLGSWVWQDVLPLLAPPALAVDLPGRAGDGRDVNRLSIADCADHVVRAIEAAGVERFILVPHSYTGVLVPKIAQRLPDRVAHVVFLATTNPPDGRGSAAIGKGVERVFTRAIMTLQRLGVPLPRAGFRSAIRSTICHDLPEAKVQWVLERLTYVEPPALFLEPVRYAGMPAVGKTYVKLLQDRLVPPRTQDVIARRLGARVRTLDAGHGVMLSHPAEIAALLNGVADEVGA